MITIPQRSKFIDTVRDYLPDLYAKYHTGFTDERLWNVTERLSEPKYKYFLALAYNHKEQELEAELLLRIK